MNKISLAETEFTPRVLLDHVGYKFEMAGEASPEDARQFFAPLIKWVEDFGNYLLYLADNNPGNKKTNLVFSFHLDYVTSSSLKNIYDMLKKIETLKPYAANVTIKWIYDPEDEDMRDNGEEFSKMVNVPFEIVSAS